MGGMTSSHDIIRREVFSRHFFLMVLRNGDCIAWVGRHPLVGSYMIHYESYPNLIQRHPFA